MKPLLKKTFKYVLFGLIVAGCLYLLAPGFAQYNKQREEIRLLEAEVKRLEAEHEQLKKYMRELENENPEHIERLAREKLHLIKPGETIFRFKKE
ncbi:MAG: hypothetical protein Kow0099_30290 [Candidatus Abyssubacteria bacterium]